MSDEQDVLIVTQFFPPESMGGAHRWEKLAAHLDDSINPHILTTHPTFPFGEFERQWQPISREERDGVPVTRLFTYQPIEDTSIGRILNYGGFSLLSSLYVLLMFWRYDAVVTMSAPHTTFLPGLWAKVLGRQWFVDIFDLWIDNAADLGYVDEGSVAYRAVSELERVSFDRADGISVITETMAEYYEEKYPELNFDVHVVPFGVDTEVFSPDVEPVRSTDVIYTGNLGTGQAFIPFFEGFSQLDGTPELTIVGGGERADELVELATQLEIEDQVRFEGYVDRDEIPKYLAGASVSIVPLKTDFQLDYARPTKLLETMAVGTPYIASSVREIAILSENHQPGCATDNDKDEITDAMSNLLSEPDRCSEMGKNGSELIKNEYSWPVIGKSTSSILHQSR